jgi:hypothetical protein
MVVVYIKRHLREKDCGSKCKRVIVHAWFPVNVVNCQKKEKNLAGLIFIVILRLIWG